MPTTNPSTLNPNPSAAALPYNPALSIWLSVDPLSDKYPGMSPYVYCADNPVRLVDKDGRDIWELDENGKLLGITADNSKDMFRITTADGDCIESPVFEPGTFGLWEEKDDVMFTVHEGDAFESFDNFRNNNSKIAFDFLKNNTNAEWECVYTTDGHFIGNTQQDNRSGGIATIALGISTNSKLKLHDHSHPSGNIVKSEADHRFSERHPNAILVISPKNSDGDVLYNRCMPYQRRNDVRLVDPMCN